MKDKQGKFSKRYYVFLDELFFEYTSINNTTNTQLFFKKYNSEITMEIDEDVIINKEFSWNINELNSIFESVKDKRILFCTNLTSSLFYKQIDSKYYISLRNIQSILATYTLYSFLHKRTKLALDFYSILLQVLYIKPEDLNEYIRKKRYKKVELHVEINTYENIYKPIKTLKVTENEFLPYEEMKEFLTF